MKRFFISPQFLKDNSLIGLNLLRKMGIKDKTVSIPAVANNPKRTERKIAKTNKVIVPMEASQMIPKRIIVIRETPKICGEKANKAPP